MKVICPNCKEEFELDENNVSEIKEQIRTNLFNEEVEKQVALKVQTAVADALAKSQTEKAQLTSDISTLKEKHNNEMALLSVQHSGEIENLKKDAETEKLKAQIEFDKQLQSVKSEYEDKLKQTNEELAYYKDYKTSLSTKGVGESLEVYCDTEFKKCYSYAFPTAEFHKDNAVSKDSGSKGDFIFRDFVDGVEFISIMFEMKNEGDTTSTKKTNEHFFKELDKDRNEKGCEYAVLVSMLEKDNDLYNQGIVDVSYSGYKKMYVVRPTFFIQIIALLRNAALNSVGYKKELVKYQNENMDIKKFEENFNEFKRVFSKHTDTAFKADEDVLKRIDDAIATLEKAKKAIQSSGNALRLANNKLIGTELTELLKNSPSLLAQLKE